MTTLFLTLLDMSLSASFVILFVFLLRWCWGLAKLPKRFSYLLWAFVLVRLLVPAMPETGFSLLPEDVTEGYTARWSEPTVYEMPEEVGQLIESEDAVQQQYSSDYVPRPIPEPSTLTEASLFTRLTPMLTAVWLLGILAIAGYNGVSLLRLRRRLADAIPLGNGVYLNDHIDTAFVMGLLRPRIYLPARLTEEEQTCILSHEGVHIRRGDHIWKLLGFLTLTLHWFNPLVWLAFSSAVQDMELSCDETVTQDMEPERRSHYAEILLRLTAGRKPLAIAPVAFGEGDVGRRIRHVLACRRPTLAITVTALVLLALLIPGLLTNPAKKTGEFGASRYDVDAGGFSYEDPNLQTYDSGPFLLTTDGTFLRSHDTAGWVSYGKAAPYDSNAEEMAYMMRYRFAYKNPVPVTEILDSKLVTYQEANGINMFFLLTRHKDGSLFISQGSCLNDGYHYKDMYIHKLFDVTPGLSENSSNGPFYNQTIGSLLSTSVTTFATHHIGDGVQVVGFVPNSGADFAMGWAAFRIENGTATCVCAPETFQTTEATGGVFFSPLPPEADGVTYDVVLVNNSAIRKAEHNGEIYELNAPDMLVLPHAKENALQFYYADGMIFDADGTVISAVSTPKDLTNHQLVRINGYLYYNTGHECALEGNRQAGIIDSAVAAGQIPTEDNQSNFGTGYHYRWYMEPYYVEVGMNGTIYRFKQIEALNDYGIELSGGGFDSETLIILCSRSTDTTQRMAVRNSFTLIDMDSGAILSMNPLKTDELVEPGETYTWTADISHLSHLLHAGDYRVELEFWFPDGDGQRFFAWHDFVYADEARS